MFSFAIDYYLAVFVAAFGVIQIAASLGELRGLVFLRSAPLARIVGVLLVAASAVWFFSTAPRNINDYEGGLDANEQAIFLALGTLTAIAVTLIASSLVNLRMKVEAGPEAGLDALEEANYTQSAVASIRYWSKQWRTRMKPYLPG